ncbi:hypothetical protein ACWEQL_18980 [Kitasatospora sp. NPDC004240]
MRRAGPHPLVLVAASALSVVAGAAVGLLVARPYRAAHPGTANLLFLFVLCSVTVVTNLMLARAAARRRS